MPGLYEMKIPLKKSECVMFRAVQCLPSAVPPARGGGWDNWPMGAVAGTAVPGPGVPPRPAETLAGGWWQPPLAPRPWRDHFLRQLYCTVLYCTGRCVLCTCTYWHCTMVGRRLEAVGGGWGRWGRADKENNHQDARNRNLLRLHNDYQGLVISFTGRFWFSLIMHASFTKTLGCSISQ